uniref:Uncharacterized protein n=1 Tax=Oryctolagus cuniculus TaxID=9986 RepID=A0A5F9CMZ7_RABIT
LVIGGPCPWPAGSPEVAELDANSLCMCKVCFPDLSRLHCFQLSPQMRFSDGAPQSELDGTGWAPLRTLNDVWGLNSLFIDLLILMIHYILKEQNIIYGIGVAPRIKWITTSSLTPDDKGKDFRSPKVC